MHRPFSSRWWSLVVMLLLLAVALPQTSRGDTLPYRAHVGQATVELRSGPGDDFYATDELAEGSELEVYQEQPDGWCAVRPPEGSFSWVFARHVRLSAGGLGEVNKDDVAARVGGRAGDQRDVVQVRLTKGEVVQILGADDQDGQTWYKIAPPSGEFRWVRKTDLVSDGALEPAAPIHPKAHEEAAVATAAAPADVWHAAPEPTDADDVSLTSGEAGGNAVTATHEQQDTAASSPASPSPSPWQPVAGKASQSQSTAPSSPTVPGDFARQVADLDLRLAQMVAQPTVSWRIDQLEAEGERLLASAEDMAQREAVKQTLAKIDRFAAIFHRYQWSSAAQTAAAAPQPANVALQGVAPGAPDPALMARSGDRPQQAATADEQPQYDAVGLLRPVVSERPGAPQYALVNEQGQVVSFVTPSPDLNLQPYLGRRIGIVGGRGYIPEFQRAHVTASRVTPLGDRIVR